MKYIKYSWNVSRRIWSDLKILKHMRSQIFYLCENLRISSKGSMDLRGKCVLWSLKPFSSSLPFVRKYVVLRTKLNEAYEMRSRIAYCQVLWQRKNYAHTKAAVLYLLHTSNSQIRFLLNWFQKIAMLDCWLGNKYLFMTLRLSFFIGFLKRSH